MSQALPDKKKNSVLWFALAITLLATAWMALGNQAEPESLVPLQRKYSAPLTSSVGHQQGGQQKLGGTGFTETNNLVRGGYQRIPIINEPQPLFSDEASAVPRMGSNVSEPQPIPALPFLYAGKLIEDANYTVFLLSGERSLAVKTGDVVEGTWRVKSIKPPSMTLTFLPLKRDIILAIGSATPLEQAIE